MLEEIQDWFAFLLNVLLVGLHIVELYPITALNLGVLLCLVYMGIASVEAAHLRKKLRLLKLHHKQQKEV